MIGANALNLFGLACPSPRAGRTFFARVEKCRDFRGFPDAEELD